MSEWDDRQRAESFERMREADQRLRDELAYERRRQAAEERHERAIERQRAAAAEEMRGREKRDFLWSLTSMPPRASRVSSDEYRGGAWSPLMSILLIAVAVLSYWVLAPGARPTSGEGAGGRTTAGDGEWAAGDHPVITGVDFGGAGQQLRMAVHGGGFGRASVSMPFSGNLPCFSFYAEGHFEAGYLANFDLVTLNYASWTPNEIRINGFSGSYGGKWSITPGDRVRITVWNPDSHFFATCEGVLAENTRSMKYPTFSALPGESPPINLEVIQAGITAINEDANRLYGGTR
jgi:hypothetical protein